MTCLTEQPLSTHRSRRAALGGNVRHFGYLNDVFGVENRVATLRYVMDRDLGRTRSSHGAENQGGRESLHRDVGRRWWEGKGAPAGNARPCSPLYIRASTRARVSREHPTSLGSAISRGIKDEPHLHAACLKSKTLENLGKSWSEPKPIQNRHSPDAAYNVDVNSSRER
jgi:hypothetical protein